MITKNSWKFILGFLAIIMLGLAGLYASSLIFNEESQDDREAKKYLKELKAQYENDTYGGNTPEETLELFIAALEKGDVELASKYFVLEKQEEWREKFRVAKTNNNLNLYVDEVSRAGNGKQIYPGSYLFTVINGRKEAEFVISLVLNEKSGIWKIEDL